MGLIVSIFSESAKFCGNFMVWIVINIIKLYYYFIRYALPFLVKYLGIPLFLGGIIVSGGFALGLLVLLVGGTSLYYKFVKKTALVPQLDLKTGKLRSII